VIPEVVAAIAADKKAGEHIFFAVGVAPPAGDSALFLNLFPYSRVNDLENGPVFLIVKEYMTQKQKIVNTLFEQNAQKCIS